MGTKACMNAILLLMTPMGQRPLPWDSADRNHEKMRSEENGWRDRMGYENQAIRRRCATGVSRHVDGADFE
jgi:hypothetical protein